MGDLTKVEKVKTGDFFFNFGNNAHRNPYTFQIINTLQFLKFQNKVKYIPKYFIYF